MTNFVKTNQLCEMLEQEQLMECMLSIRAAVKSYTLEPLG